MKSPHAERSHGRRGFESKKPQKSAVQQFKSVWPQIRELVLPRGWLLALGFTILVINRIMGLVLPYSTRTLGDIALRKPVQQWQSPSFIKDTFSYLSAH